jgi:hypothetical protein
LINKTDHYSVIGWLRASQSTGWGQTSAMSLIFFLLA